VHRNPSKKARDVALSYAAAIGGGKAGVIETSFKEEDRDRPLRRADRALRWMCRAGQGRIRHPGGAGYAPEMAYFECLHELKLIGI